MFILSTIAFIATSLGCIDFPGNSCMEAMLTRFFYCGFDILDPDIATQRRLSLFTDYNAAEITCTNDDGQLMDVVYIPALPEVATGNAIVICLNTTYQDHHPHRWLPFLQNGADIVLWNPTRLGGVAYSNELASVLHILKNANPDQTLIVKTYCASSDPAIKAVAELSDDRVHLIIDRGYGDVQQLARSFTVFANLPMVKALLSEKFDCKGIEKIQAVNGQILFLIPREVDQVMDYGTGCNLTLDLAHLRGDATVLRAVQDHWSDWGFQTYDAVLGFLARLGVVCPDFQPTDPAEFPEPPPLSYFSKECVPCLTKSPFQ